jgi:HEPN domain-containing protein
MEIKEVAEWLIIADEEIKTAGKLNKDADPDIYTNIYYHCSQAIEKLLKGYLIFNDKGYNKNHNISQSLWNCIKNDESFKEILLDCNKMTQLVQNLRYPGRMKPTKEDIKRAFSLIDSVKQLKPINNIYNNLNENFGINWKDVLFKTVVEVETNVSDFNNKENKEPDYKPN